jgi:hypothetical protein
MFWGDTEKDRKVRHRTKRVDLKGKKMDIELEIR